MSTKYKFSDTMKWHKYAITQKQCCILAPGGDALGHAYVQKNAGAFPEVYRNAPLSSERGFRFFMSHSSDFSRHYFRVWEQQGIKSFIYEIPRRFRTLIPFTPRFY